MGGKVESSKVPVLFQLHARGTATSMMQVGYIPEEKVYKPNQERPGQTSNIQLRVDVENVER